MANHLHIDFETYSTVDLKLTGADLYSMHPSTGAWCMGFAFNDDDVFLWRKEDAFPPEIIKHVEDGGTCIAHNGPFELAIWNNVLRRSGKLPPLSPKQTVCTMAMAYAMGLPGSLEKAAAAVGLNMQKDMHGHRVMLQLSQPRRIEKDGTVVWWDELQKFQTLYRYCIQDIEVERALYKRLLPLSPAEREIWLVDYEINQRGVAVDLKAVKTAIDLVELEKERLNHEMRRVTNNAVATCTATAQLTDWLRTRGIETDGVAKADVSEILSQNIPDDCRVALLLRQEAAKSSTSKLESMLNSAASDKRIRGLFQYHGATTGRWAGRRIQPQNFPRPRLSEPEIERVFEILDGVR